MNSLNNDAAKGPPPHAPLIHFQTHCAGSMFQLFLFHLFLFHLFLFHLFLFHLFLFQFRSSQITQSITHSIKKKVIQFF